MSILITGSRGGFGVIFLPLMRSYFNEEVIGSDLISVDENNYINCDYSDITSVERVIKTIKPRLIFHLVGSFTNDFEYDFKANVLCAKNVFDSMLKTKTEARVVILGSAAEYGLVLPSENPISETHLCQPTSIYGVTKYFQTELAKYYARTKLVDIVIARLFNLAAPGLSDLLFYGRALKLIQQYKLGKILQLDFGNLNSVRDYIEPSMAADQLIAIAEKGISGQVYNVGSGIPQKIRTILESMLKREKISNAQIVEFGYQTSGQIKPDVSVIYADINRVLNLKD
jgi:nucleoside-diphosphate-sugar epimerase